MPHGHGASIWAVLERFRRIYDERYCFLHSFGAPVHFVLGGASFDSRHVGCDHWVVLMGLRFSVEDIGMAVAVIALSWLSLVLCAFLTWVIWSVIFGDGNGLC